MLHYCKYLMVFYKDVRAKTSWWEWYPSMTWYMLMTLVCWAHWLIRKSRGLSTPKQPRQGKMSSWMDYLWRMWPALTTWVVPSMQEVDLWLWMEKLFWSCVHQWLWRHFPFYSVAPLSPHFPSYSVTPLSPHFPFITWLHLTKDHCNAPQPVSLGDSWSFDWLIGV